MDTHTAAGDGASAVLAAGPAAVFRRLLDDEDLGAAETRDDAGPAGPHGTRRATTALVARRVLDAFLSAPTEAYDAGRDAGHGSGAGSADDAPSGPAADPGAIADRVRAARGALAPLLAALCERSPGTRRLVLRQRSPLLLPGGARRRHRALIGHGVHLPVPGAPEFARRSQARPLTLLHAAFRLALTRLPGPFLPEVVGAHYAMTALGADALLLGADDPGAEARARTVLADYLALTEHAPTGARDRQRLGAAVALVLRLEREHAELLGELADWHEALDPDARVARILLRHTPYPTEPGPAGPERTPRPGRLDVTRLPEWLDDENRELADFTEAFRRSLSTRPAPEAVTDFGGPLFGLLDEDEAALFARWGESVVAGGPATLAFHPNSTGDAAALVWARRLANVERFPHLRSAPGPAPEPDTGQAAGLISRCR